MGRRIPRNTLKNWQAAGEAGTKCCPHERGHYGHCTGWKRISATCRQTSYSFCTYRSSFQGSCGLFYSTHFYLIPRHNTKEYMVFITGVPAIVRVRFFCALVYARGRKPCGKLLFFCEFSCNFEKVEIK